jgi:hypothetical protein
MIVVSKASGAVRTFICASVPDYKNGAEEFTAIVSRSRIAVNVPTCQLDQEFAARLSRDMKNCPVAVMKTARWWP